MLTAYRAGGLDWPGGRHFTGDVHALPKGNAFFADEPVLRVSAPVTQARLAESRLVNLLQLPMLVSSKAARRSRK